MEVVYAGPRTENPPLWTLHRKRYHCCQMHFSGIVTFPNQLFTLLFTSDVTWEQKQMANSTRLAPKARTSLFSLNHWSDCDNSGDVFFWISSKMQNQIVCLFLDIAGIVCARASLEVNLISPLHGPVVIALIEMRRVFSQILPIVMFAFPINNSFGKSQEQNFKITSEFQKR